MNVAVTTAAEGFPRRAFTVEDISRMMGAGVIGEDARPGSLAYYAGASGIFALS